VPHLLRTVLDTVPATVLLQLCLSSLEQQQQAGALLAAVARAGGEECPSPLSALNMATRSSAAGAEGCVLHAVLLLLLLLLPDPPGCQPRPAQTLQLPCAQQH
jgi:hypothetical protein